MKMALLAGAFFFHGVVGRDRLAFHDGAVPC